MVKDHVIQLENWIVTDFEMGFANQDGLMDGHWLSFELGLSVDHYWKLNWSFYFDHDD